MNRANWQVGDRFWLAACEEGQGAQFRREGELLKRLTRILHTQSVPFRVPTPIPVRNGELSTRVEGHEWRLAVRLAGRPADPASEALYEPYVSMLADLHRVLRSIPADEGSIAIGALERARSLVAARAEPGWRPATEDASESLVVQEIGEWIASRLDRLSSLPAQLVHGDWTPSNVLLAADEEPRVVAVLDFEHSRPAPIELDLAQLFSTLLMWSGFDQARATGLMRRSLRVYEDAAERAVDAQDVHTCMAVYWLINYWTGRELSMTTRRFDDALSRQPSRLRAVLSFVKSVAS